MIAIFSKCNYEYSTEKVIDWLHYLKADLIRINATDFYEDLDYSNTSFNKNFDKINVCWFRRWMDEDYIKKKIKTENCPSMNKSFGNLNDNEITDVIQKESFRKYWNITKDQITECMDCEYRYICTDCRAFIKDHNNELSKPSKCNYDPYTATWS